MLQMNPDERLSGKVVGNDRQEYLHGTSFNLRSFAFICGKQISGRIESTSLNVPMDL